MSEITPTRVTQGKTRANSNLYVAAHAADKDLSTQAVTNTDNGAGWLKLEFDKTYLIHKVVIYYRFYHNWFTPHDGCTLSKTNFKTCVNYHNNVEVSVFQGEVKQKSCGTLQLTYGLEQSDQIYTLVCDARGDILQLSKNTEDIAVFEVVTISKLKGKEKIKPVWHYADL